MSRLPTLTCRLCGQAILSEDVNYLCKVLNSTTQVNQFINLLYTYSYLILFPLVVIEGPLVTIITGFLVSLGFMGFIPSYLIIISADLTGDVIYYSAGRWWLNRTYKGVLNFFHINLELVHRLEKALRKNRGPTLFFGKLSHAVGGLILFAAGSAGIPLKEFLEFNFFATLPKSLILLGAGYYFGRAVNNLQRTLDYTVLGLFVVTLILIGIYFTSVRLSDNLIKRFGK